MGFLPPCPLSCRCWPRPGLFSEQEVALLSAVSLWAAKSTDSPCPHVGLITALAEATSVDRVGYVLSTPVATFGLAYGWVGSLLDRCLRSRKSDVARRSMLTLLLSYGVCTATSRRQDWPGQAWGFTGTSLFQHPGRLQCTGQYLPPVLFCRSMVALNAVLKEVEHGLVQAGAFPHGCRRTNSAWLRWHGDAALQRRHWLALCTRAE